MTFYAHTKEETPQSDWQSLSEHLTNVSRLAGQFSAQLNATKWGELVGLLHDIGKHSPDFQKRLTGENRRSADHKGIGAKLFKELGSGFGLLCAYCVAGHHGGLPDCYGTDGGRSLEDIVRRAAALPNGIESPLKNVSEPPFPFALKNSFQCSFFTRMLFSALVDADFLDTEAFMDAEKNSWRTPKVPLVELRKALDIKLANFTANGRINSLRAEILVHCRKQAALPPGLFTLTVPTGGGKTLTSMAFALDHALLHDMERIIYVIPYTSIIEQNAKVFREIFPPNSVLEHHSNFDTKTVFEHEDFATETAEVRRHRLACENWDSPVVVTTNVQFFESLYANKPSKCRKLHNLAKSVIILDEAQMLPVETLSPCLRALEELAQNYGTSVVLCTATQPALRQEDFSSGLAGLGNDRELAPDPQKMHEAFRRTELRNCGEKSLSEVAEMIREREKVLCIVNTRARASELFESVRDEAGASHLSALMCPAHRSRCLEDIRKQLNEKRPCRVVSTQLVEAGVDISFPEVIREAAGLDSITQAAGRCNREGDTDSLAPVSLFIPAEGLPRAFSGPAGHTGAVLRSGKDPFSPDAIKHYFTLHYWLQENILDKHAILRDLSSDQGEYYFRKAAKKFRIIKNTMEPVIIPYDDRAKDLIHSLRHVEHPGGVLRELQQYTVQIYENQFKALDEAGAIEMVAGIYAVLNKMDFYDEQLGLTFPIGMNPESFLT